MVGSLNSDILRFANAVICAQSDSSESKRNPASENKAVVVAVVARRSDLHAPTEK